MDSSDAVSSLRACLRELRAAGLVDSYERVDLAAWTALRVGGISDLLIRCRTAEGARETLDLLASHGLRWVTMGSGSRLVPPDRPLRVPVVTVGGSLADWELLEGAVEAGGGAGVAQLQRSIASAGVSGTPRLFGISGTAGGAVEDALTGRDFALEDGEWVEVVRPGAGPHQHRSFDAAGLEYLQRTLVTRVRMNVVESGGSGARAVVVPVPARTVAPLFHCMGDEPVEALLERAGCPGLFVGGARIDASQPNALRTARSATARDVQTLCREVCRRVHRVAAVELRPRVRFIDEWGRGIDG